MPRAPARRYVIRIAIDDEDLAAYVAENPRRFIERVQHAIDREFPFSPMGTIEVGGLVRDLFEEH